MIALTFKFMNHLNNDSELFPPADKIFHLHWIACCIFAIIFDGNTVYYSKQLLFAINNYLVLDEQLTGIQMF